MLVKAELASKADKVKLGKEEVNEVTYINYASRTTIMKKGGGIQRGRQLHTKGEGVSKIAKIMRTKWIAPLM